MILMLEKSIAYTLPMIFLFIFLIYILVKSIKKLRRNDYLAIILFVKSSITPIFIIVGSIIFYFFTPIINKWLHTEFNSNVILKFCVIIPISWLLLNLIDSVEKIIRSHIIYNKEENFHERTLITKLNYLKKITQIFIILMTIAALLFLIDSIRSVAYTMLASAGLITAIIGFSAQKTLSTLIAGFQIAFTQPIRVNDIVFIENEMAYVEEITMTYVVLRIWDKRRLIFPVNYFIEKPFQNWTRNSNDLIGKIFLLVHYEVNIHKLRKYFYEILSNNPLWDKRTQSLQVVGNNETGITIRILISATNASDTWDLQCEIRENLIEYLKNNYRHPFSDKTFRLVNDK